MIQMSFTGGRKMTHFRLSNPTKENFKNSKVLETPNFEGKIDLIVKISKSKILKYFSVILSPYSS